MTPPLASTAAARAKPARRVSGEAPPGERPGARVASSPAPVSPAPRPNSGTRVARPPRRGVRPGRGTATRPARRVSGPASTPPGMVIRIAGTSVRLPVIRLGSLPQLRPMPVVGPIGVRALEFGRALPDSRVVDRLVRARLWVALLAILLFGLVAINVSMLKLNSESGRNAEAARTLGIRNTQLHAKVSRLASGERIQTAARALGFSLPTPDQIDYLNARGNDGKRAAKALRSGALAGPALVLQAPLPSPAPAPTDTTSGQPTAKTNKAAGAPTDTNSTGATQNQTNNTTTNTTNTGQAPSTTPGAATPTSPSTQGQPAPQGTGGQTASPGG